MRVESNNNNEIYLQLSLDHLAKALRSASVSPPYRRSEWASADSRMWSQDATQVTAKLAKRGGNQGKGDGAYPVLSLVIESSVRCRSSLSLVSSETPH